MKKPMKKLFKGLARSREEYDRMKEDYNDFLREEADFEFQCFLEDVGMVCHADFTSEPRDIGETEH